MVVLNHEQGLASIEVDYEGTAPVQWTVGLTKDLKARLSRDDGGKGKEDLLNKRFGDI